MPRYKLRTLLIVLAISPPMLAISVPPLVARLWPQQPERPEINLDALFVPIASDLHSIPAWDNDHDNEWIYNPIWIDPGKKE
jgi:hypothetical protein